MAEENKSDSIPPSRVSTQTRAINLNINNDNFSLICSQASTAVNRHYESKLIDLKAWAIGCCRICPVEKNEC